MAKKDTSVLKDLSKSDSVDLKLSILSAYGIHLEKDMTSEAFDIIQNMAKKSFFEEMNKFQPGDLFTEKSGELLKVFINHFKLEQTPYSNIHYYVNTFDFLNVESAAHTIKSDFISKNVTEIKKSLKNVLISEDSIKDSLQKKIPEAFIYYFVKACQQSYYYALSDNSIMDSTEFRESYSDFNISRYFRFISHSSKGSDFIDKASRIRDNMKTRELELVLKHFDLQNVFTTKIRSAAYNKFFKSLTSVRYHNAELTNEIKNNDLLRFIGIFERKVFNTSEAQIIEIINKTTN